VESKKKEEGKHLMKKLLTIVNGCMK